MTDEQPMPTPNDSISIQHLVREDLFAREQIGRERYGTSLQAHNGRDALRDAYEEALDLACYLRQVIEERGVPPRRQLWIDSDGDRWIEMAPGSDLYTIGDDGDARPLAWIADAYGPLTPGPLLT